MSEGLDTALARRVHGQGWVPLDVLQRLLGEARRARPDSSEGEDPEADPDLTLAWLLIERRLVSPAQLDEALRELQAEARARVPPVPGAGQRIGPYLVLGLLGRGGMGAVYRARAEDGREVALKVLPALGDADERERFEREAALLGVEHPNLVRTLDRGGGASPYLVLELLEGGSLAERIAREPLALPELARLIEELCAGLEALHAAGVLHRDLKPANVLFGRDGVARLADFGLARLPGSQTLTRTGELLGTPSYMAPEQARDASRVGPASDVYGLAATIFAAATGRPPFAGAGLLETLLAVMEEAPPDPRSLRAELPAAFAAGLLRALAKDPLERPQSPAELRAALPLEGGPRVRRARTAGLVAGALALVLGALLGGVLLARPGGPSGQATPSAPRATPLRPKGLEELLAARERSPREEERLWELAEAEPPRALLDRVRIADRRWVPDALWAYAKLGVGEPVPAREVRDPGVRQALEAHREAERHTATWKKVLKEGLLREALREPPALVVEHLLAQAKRVSPTLPAPLRRRVIGVLQSALSRALVYFSMSFGSGKAEDVKERLIAEIGALEGTPVSSSRSALFAWRYGEGDWEGLPNPSRGELYRRVSAVLVPSEELDSLDEILVGELAQLEEPDAERADAWARRALTHQANVLEVTNLRRVHLRRAIRLIQVCYERGRLRPHQATLQLAKEAWKEADDYPDFQERLVGRQGVVLELLSVQPGGDLRAAREAAEGYSQRFALARDGNESDRMAYALLRTSIELAEGKRGQAQSRARAFFAEAWTEAVPLEAHALAAHAEAICGEGEKSKVHLANYLRLAPESIRIGLPWYAPEVIEETLQGERWWPRAVE